MPYKNNLQTLKNNVKNCEPDFDLNLLFILSIYPSFPRCVVYRPVKATATAAALSDA